MFNYLLMWTRISCIVLSAAVQLCPLKCSQSLNVTLSVQTYITFIPLFLFDYLIVSSSSPSHTLISATCNNRE